jgi:uncharacterized Ntn-hydrolase superfamily protein
VPWARPGVGAVATQSMIRVDYGPRGLELMACGVSAPDALTQLRDRDEGAESRQVAMIDATGAVGAFTGQQASQLAQRIGRILDAQQRGRRAPGGWSSRRGVGGLP